MLIRFNVENWMSFRDEASFSMVASKERQHGERVPKIGKYQMRVLPVAAMYGGNASGKTNFFRALNFAKVLIVKGTQPEGLIPIERFRLDPEMMKRPARFSFELLIQERIYEYSFAVTASEVVTEKLVLITSSSETELFSRQGASIQFDASLEGNQFLQFAFRGMWDNQLFLTNSVSQKVNDFRPVFDWFRNSLELIAPDSRFEPFEQFLDEAHPLYATMNGMLPLLDTGIAHLGVEEVSFSTLSLPDFIKSRLQEDVKEGMAVKLLNDAANERVVITRENGELVAKKLMTVHACADGSEIAFEMKQESDGSQRVIDLLPAFLEMGAAKADKVYIIDELDRSLHSQLTRRLLEGFLGSCSPESRSQLLFTTHDVSLMDQGLFRRDEMWVTERDATGCSQLMAFSDYRDIRYDKDIRKSYLQGRLGGVPRIHACGRLSDWAGAI
jgi:uncharacterized protein